MTLASLRYVPEFRVFINDEPIPAALRASISEVNYQTGLEGADRVELTLVNENLRWLDHDLLALDNKLTLAIGYAPETPQQVFAGEIVGQNAAFAGGTPTLTVAAQDRIRRLQQGSKVRWFANSTPSVGNFARPDPAVVQTVSRENELTPIVEPVGAALGVLLGDIQAVANVDDPQAAQKVVRKQDEESDYDFLLRIARENGWEMHIEHTGTQGGLRLRFMSPAEHLSSEVTLGYGRSLLDFTPRISNVGQLTAVTAYVWVASLKKLFTVTVSWDWKEMALNLSIRPGRAPAGDKPSEHLIEEPVTPISAPRKIIREFIPTLNQRQTGTGSTVGDPRIRAGTVLQLEGLGKQFGGLYRVTSATHTIDSSGYRTRFEVRKEIWFSSVPLQEQGAVSVQQSSAVTG